MSADETEVEGVEPVEVAGPETAPQTAEQIAGRPLVDLTVDELQDVARDVDLDGRSAMKRDELIVALGGDPDAMTDAQRVAAAADVAAAEADGETVDPSVLAPWERHDDVVEPLSREQMLAAMAAASGAITESTIDQDTGERKVVTWAQAEAFAQGREPGPSTDVE